MDLGTGLLKLSREDREARRAIMLDRPAVKKSGCVKHFPLSRPQRANWGNGSLCHNPDEKCQVCYFADLLARCGPARVFVEPIACFR